MKATIEVPVGFSVLYEQHDKKTFQAENHFVPPTRKRDANGHLTSQERPWKGKLVHAVTLLGPDGKPHRTGEKQDSTHRAISDSRKEAERILSDQIRDGFFGRLRAMELETFNAEQLRRVKDERDRMVFWFIANREPAVLAEILRVDESEVQKLKAAESDPNLRAKVDALLGGRA